MSVIQTIRDKYATLMIVIICVSLVAFLLMDAFVGPKSFFQHSNDVGEINGQSIGYRNFASQMQLAENNYRASTQSGTIDDNARHQLREQVWNQFVSNVLMGEEYEQLGIGFSDEEMKDLTVTPNADPQIKSIQVFSDPNTGVFDPNRVIEFLRQMGNTPQGSEQRQQWLQLEDYLRTSSLSRKFYSLVKEALFVPGWLQKEDERERDTYVNFSYVGIPYTTISDSSVKISDAELTGYLNEHASLFQQEASRRLEYISFDAVPTSKDTASIAAQIAALKPMLDTVTSAGVEGFINRNSETQFFDGYVPRDMMQDPNTDSIINLPVGGVFGPYYESGLMACAKLVDKKMMPDTVKVRHILISIQTTPDSIAKQRIDSIEGAIKNGADFGAMVQRFSDDKGSVQTGGEYTLTQVSSFVPEFKNFAFSHHKGDMGVVKSQYGYHLIEVMQEKNIGPAYKVAYLSKRMDPSQETDNRVFSRANEFAGKNRTRPDFDKAAQTEGLNKRIAEAVKQTDYQITGVGPARELIRWAFDAKIGDVSTVFSLGSHYVVAVLTGIKEKGLAKVEDVRPQLEAIVRQEKKAALIAGKMKGTDLTAVAKSADDSVMHAQHLNFMTPFVPNAGFEPKVIGAAFDKALGTDKISKPVYGNNGVYVIKVDSTNTEAAAAPAIGASTSQQAEATLQQNVLSRLFDMLKKQGEIEDYRLKFF